VNPVLLGSLAALCWGSLDFLAGRTSSVIGAARTTAGVTITGLLVLTLWLASAASFPDLMRSDIWIPLAAGAGFALATLWLFGAISSGPVSLAVPIVMSYPATTVVVAAALGRWPSTLQLALVVFIMAGVVLAAVAESHEDADTISAARRWRTISLAALSHATFLVSVMAGQHAAGLFGEVEAVWISRLSGSLVVVPLLLGVRVAANIDWRLGALLVFMGALDVAGSSLLFAAGRTSHPELAIVSASASGAVTVILAWLILKERIPAWRWIGISMTFAGIGALSAVK
jgi:drug/metabolite transporter (DMT)-like permease